MNSTLKAIGKSTWYASEGAIIFSKIDGNDQILLNVRGWGRLSKLTNNDDTRSIKIQDDIGEFISNAINSKLKPCEWKWDTTLSTYIASCTKKEVGNTYRDNDDKYCKYCGCPIVKG